MFSLDQVDFTNLYDSQDGEDDDAEDDFLDLTVPPYRYEKLEIDGHSFDLRNPSDVDDALNTIQDYQQQMKDGELLEYEGKSTELFGGGRSRINYDAIRVKIAVDYHKGLHSIDWQDQHFEAKRIQEYQRLRYAK